MNDTEQQHFDTRFDSWLKACQEIVDRGYDKYENLDPPVLSAQHGQKFIKIVRQSADPKCHDRSVHAFVVLEDSHTKTLGTLHRGDVLKPATWKTPARHARGNIFDDKQGIGHMSQYGPAYLK